MDNQELNKNKQTPKNEYEIKRQQKLVQQQRIEKKHFLKKFTKITFISIIVVGIIGGVIWYGATHFFKPRTNREVALTCTTDMATQFHIHPNLEIMINGQKQEIPANIGVHPTCMNSLHTHDNSGQIHVESSEKRDFTLADFFAVWKKTYSKEQILDYKVDATHVMRETVNGQETQDYENTILRDKDQIIIYYEEIKQ